jgi:hypothetical protein
VFQVKHGSQHHPTERRKERQKERKTEDNCGQATYDVIIVFQVKHGSQHHPTERRKEERQRFWLSAFKHRAPHTADFNDISGDELTGLDFADVSVVLSTQDLGHLGLKLLQCIDGILSVALLTQTSHTGTLANHACLPHSDDSIADENHKNNKWLDKSGDLLLLVVLEERKTLRSSEQTGHSRTDTPEK